MGELELLQLSTGTRALAATRASGSLSVLPPPVLLDAARRVGGDLRLVIRHAATGDVAVVVLKQGAPTMVFLPGDGRSLGELLLAAGVVDLATLDGLVQGRVEGVSSLERLLQEKSSVPPEKVQAFLDFQARARLLDVLAWREGFFDLQAYRGGGETAFSLELPGLDSLAFRASARAEALPGLLAALPAPPSRVIVRRRRGGSKPGDQLGADVFAALAEPLLITQLVARLLVDDDLAIQAVLRLAEAKSVVLQPRVELAPPPPPGVGPDPRLGIVLREAVSRTRVTLAEDQTATLTVVVMSASPGDAVRLVARLGGDGGEGAEPEDGAGSTGLASCNLALGDRARLFLIAIRPEALSRGALEGVLSRVDALVLVRTGEDPAELDRLQQLRALTRAGAGREPLTLGIDIGRSLRPWGDFPDALLGLVDPVSKPTSWLLERVVEGLLAAATARG